MTKQTHKRWLKFTALVIGSFGPVFSLGSMTQTMQPARLTLDLLSWPLDGKTTFLHPDTRFLSALTGGFQLLPSASRARMNLRPVANVCR